MNSSEILQAVLTAAIPVIITLAGYLLKLIREWALAHIRGQWLQIIATEAFDVVAYVQQEIAIPAKEAAADGKLDETEKARIKAVALSALEKRLRDIPAHLFPDLAVRLGQAIEAAVPMAKAAAVNPQSGPVSK